MSEAARTEEFFAGALVQYANVSDTGAAVDVVTETGHSPWAEVTWSYDGTPAERNMYQLVRMGQAWKIAVLTPLGT